LSSLEDVKKIDNITNSLNKDLKPFLKSGYNSEKGTLLTVFDGRNWLQNNIIHIIIVIYI